MEMEELVELALLNYKEDYEEDIKSVKPYRDTLLLTNDNGVLVKMADGTEFQITIVKSR